MKVSYDEEVPDILNLSIGQLQAGKTATVVVEMVTLLVASSWDFLNFSFPVEFFANCKANEIIFGKFGV